MDIMRYVQFISAVCSILSFLMQFFDDSAFWQWICGIFVVLFLCSWGYYYYLKVEKTSVIHRRAKELYNYTYELNFNEEQFLEEVRVFMNSIKDQYPREYKEVEKFSKDIYHPINGSNYVAVNRIFGILKGIANS